MKILVVSLLRLGDFIQVLPVIEGYKRKFPLARVDVLVHTPVLALRPLLPIVDHWHTIDRDELQSGLGRADIPLLTSFDILREQCQVLAEEKYDLIVNLTQTEFSAWLTGYIPAKAKLGLTFNSRGQSFFHSPWFRYLNQSAGPHASDVMNYSDIFAHACEVAGVKREWPMTATDDGEREADALNLTSHGERIAVQALTSDVKKNWGAKNWIGFLNSVAGRRPHAQLILLGAPNERAALEDLRLNCADPSRIVVAILSLDGALALLNRCSTLITGDTSIKHLANAAQCRVIELSMGSSDYRRTGIYKPDSLIVQGRVPCSPCPHSSPCSQVSHLCAEKLDAGLIAAASDMFLNNDWPALEALEANSKLELLRTRILGTGLWYAGPVGPADLESTMEVWIERSAQKFLLDGAERGLVPAFGTEVYMLGEELARLIPDQQFSSLLSHLDFLESELVDRRARCSSERSRFSIPKERPAVLDLSQLRSVQNRIDSESREIEVKSKLIRSLRTRLAEII